MTSHSLIYLAVPYTDPQEAVKAARIKAFCQYDSYLMRQGVFTVSPMHKLLNKQHDAEMPTTWSYWEDYARNLIVRCTEVWVLTLGGWETSEGVQGEIQMAEDFNKSVRYVRVDEIEQATGLSLTVGVVAV